MKSESQSKMEELLELMNKVSQLNEKISELKLEISEKAFELSEYDPDFAASLSTKTPFKNKYYSIKSRYNPELKKRLAFITSSDRPFGSWLKGKNKKSTITEASDVSTTLISSSED
jgi:predicted  nucleic acid-binding Zn-ribbon protein